LLVIFVFFLLTASHPVSHPVPCLNPKRLDPAQTPKIKLCIVLVQKKSADGKDFGTLFYEGSYQSANGFITSKTDQSTALKKIVQSLKHAFQAASDLI